MTEVKPEIFLVDDDASVLKAVSRMLRANGLKAITYPSATAFLQACNPAAHGCVVLDVSMPGLDGLQLQAALAEQGCTLPIVFLTGQGDIPMSVHAMKNGAVDFLTKPAHDDDLLAAIRSAIEKDRALRQARLERLEVRRRLETLTPREREVFECVVAGMLNKQTASELGTAEKTVKVHRGRIMEKMQVDSLADLVRMAERAGVAPRALHG